MSEGRIVCEEEEDRRLGEKKGRNQEKGCSRKSSVFCCLEAERSGSLPVTSVLRVL